MSNQRGSVNVGGQDPASSYAYWGESGGVQINEYVGDCNSSDTSGAIHGFDEVSGSNHVAACYVYSNDIGGTTHRYETSIWSTQDCGYSDCVANFMDGSEKHEAQIDGDLIDIYAQGELDRDSGTWYDGNTAVRGTFPGNGTIRWSRTDDVLVNNIAQDWTVIGSAPCGSTTTGSGHWYRGSLSGGFQIYFVTSGATCG